MWPHLLGYFDKHKTNKPIHIQAWAAELYRVAENTVQKHELLEFHQLKEQVKVDPTFRDLWCANTSLETISEVAEFLLLFMKFQLWWKGEKSQDLNFKKMKAVEEQSSVS